MIEHINIGELPIYTGFLRLREAFIVSDKDFCFLSFLSLITIFYFIEAYFWINPKVLSLSGGFHEGLAAEA